MSFFRVFFQVNLLSDCPTSVAVQLSKVNKLNGAQVFVSCLFLASSINIVQARDIKNPRSCNFVINVGS